MNTPVATPASRTMRIVTDFLFKRNCIVLVQLVLYFDVTLGAGVSDLTMMVDKCN